jgi:hypothetical protein
LHVIDIGKILLYTKTLAATYKLVQDNGIRLDLKREEEDIHAMIWQMKLVRGHGAIAMDGTDQPSPSVVHVGRRERTDERVGNHLPHGSR